MKKILIRMLALFMALGIALAGCAQSPPASATEPLATEAQTPEQTQPEPTAEKTTLTAMFLGSSQDQPVVDIIKSQTDKFNSGNAYNAEFVFEIYENEQYKTKLTTVMASNSAPDVFFTWSAGYLQPFVEGDKVHEVGQLLDADHEWKGRFNDGVFGPVTYSGGVYAVPHGQTLAVMFYNTRLFSENGVPVPKSFDELKAACETFLAAGVTPISVTVKDAWIAGQFLQQLVNGVGGISLFNGTVDGSLRWDDPRYIAAGENLLELVNLGAFPDGYLGMTNDEGRDVFAQEKAAMYYMDSWDMGMLSGEDAPVSANIGVFNIPADDPAAGNVAIGDVDQCLAISANCKSIDAAAAYIKLFSEIEAQEAYAYSADYLISTKTKLDEGRLTPLFVKHQQPVQGADRRYSVA
ncbi:MAG: extracellular solute-binding protein [Clostridiales bacterium]|nr:extracellular solute-binding protein [Clostridiales bacterium]